MLVLSRKEKQTILVGDDIKITICRVSGKRVSIGLSAPKHVDIRRGEVRSDLPPLSRLTELRALFAQQSESSALETVSLQVRSASE